MRPAISVNAAAKAAGRPSATGSGTDQWSVGASKGTPASRARSQTETTSWGASRSASYPLGVASAISTPSRRAARTAEGWMRGAGSAPALSAGERVRRRQSAAAKGDRAELWVQTNTTPPPWTRSAGTSAASRSGRSTT